MMDCEVYKSFFLKFDNWICVELNSTQNVLTRNKKRWIELPQ